MAGAGAHCRTPVRPRPMRVQWSSIVIRNSAAADARGCVLVTCQGVARGDRPRETTKLTLPAGVASVHHETFEEVTALGPHEWRVLATFFAAPHLVPHAFEGVWDLVAGRVCVPGIRVVLASTDASVPACPASCGAVAASERRLEMLDMRRSGGASGGASGRASAGASDASVSHTGSAYTVEEGQASAASCGSVVAAPPRAMANSKGFDNPRWQVRITRETGFMDIMTDLSVAIPAMVGIRYRNGPDGVRVMWDKAEVMWDVLRRLLDIGNIQDAPAVALRIADDDVEARNQVMEQRWHCRIAFRMRVSETLVMPPYTCEMNNLNGSSGSVMYDLQLVMNAMSPRFLRVDHPPGRYLLRRCSADGGWEKTVEFDGGHTQDLQVLAHNALDEGPCVITRLVNGGTRLNGLRHWRATLTLHGLDGQLSAAFPPRVTITGTFPASVFWEGDKFLLAGNILAGGIMQCEWLR